MLNALRRILTGCTSSTSMHRTLPLGCTIILINPTAAVAIVIVKVAVAIAIANFILTGGMEVGFPWQLLQWTTDLNFNIGSIVIYIEGQLISMPKAII